MTRRVEKGELVISFHGEDESWDERVLGERERERLSQQSSSSRSAGAKGGFGLFNAVKHSLSGMMDVDPEATRRANIGKTRDNISQVSSSYHESRHC